MNQALVCPNCGSTKPGRFCPECGQERGASVPGVRQLALLLLEELDLVVHRVGRSLWLLVAHPGGLTSAWVRGERISHAHPIRLFLATSILVFAVWSFTSDAPSLFEYQAGQLSAVLERAREIGAEAGQAPPVLSQISEGDQLQAEEIGRFFDRGVELALGLISVPLVGLLAWLILARCREPASFHVVFSLHVHAFALLLGTVSLALSGLTASSWLSPDVVLVGAGIYTGLAAREAYGLRNWWVIPSGVVLALAYYVVTVSLFGAVALAL